MNTLKLIAFESIGCGKIDLTTETRKMYNDAHKEGHIVWSLPCFYGKVEKAVGYDIGICLNGEVFASLEKDGKISVKDGIYDAELHGYDGKLKAYIWNGEDNKAKALIVDVTDEESVKYAEECYNKDQQWL